MAEFGLFFCNFGGYLSPLILECDIVREGATVTDIDVIHHKPYLKNAERESDGEIVFCLKWHEINAFC